MNLLNVPVFSWGISNIWGIYFFPLWWYYFEEVNFVESVWWGREGWPSFQGRFIAVLISSTFHSPRKWYFFSHLGQMGGQKKIKRTLRFIKEVFPPKEEKKIGMSFEFISFAAVHIWVQWWTKSWRSGTGSAWKAAPHSRPLSAGVLMPEAGLTGLARLGKGGRRLGAVS